MLNGGEELFRDLKLNEMSNGSKEMGCVRAVKTQALAAVCMLICRRHRQLIVIKHVLLCFIFFLSLKRFFLLKVLHSEL